MADLNFTEEDNKAVEWCETNHPGICDEYKKNHDEPIHYIL